MKIDAKDPRWTAYALGEITDERERAEIESILQESLEMRQLVEEIRQTAGLLKEELQEEPAVHLTQAQRERIEAKATPGRRWFGLKPAWVMAGAAAAVMVITSVTFLEVHKEIGPDITQMAALNEEKSFPAPSTDLEQPLAPERRAISSSSTKEDIKEKDESFARVELEAQMAAVTRQNAKSQAVLEGRDKDDSKMVLVDAKGEGGAPAEKPMQESIPASPVPTVAGTAAATVALPSSNIAADDIKRAFGEASQLVAGIPGDAVPGPGSAIDSGADSYEATENGSVAGEQSHSSSPVTAEFHKAPVAAELPPAPAKALPLLSNDLRQLDKSRVGEFKTVFDGGAGEGLRMSRDGVRVMPPRPPREDRRRFPQPRIQHNTEAYDHISDNPFLNVTENPLSTFSIDVDTASYANVRRFLDDGNLPPKDAVRIEELVNYFDYDYRGPKDEKPFAAHFELTEAPWNTEHRLLRIGLKGREIDPRERPDSNLVFLLDVSGSMSDHNKLPLVKDSMHLLVDRLAESDRVAIVVYASNTRLVLPSTSGDQKQKLRRTIDRLRAGGSTNGASGIQLAYETARKNFMEGGVNRIILATDGDFNVGITNRGDLTRLIEEKAESGIYLSALGFGMGNYKDSTLELLADKGRGNYAYIDTMNEAKKVLVDQINATLVPIAKDVKIQVEFNPRHVSAYRLIGYEDRLMAKEDFNDDAKQAGVIGAGHTVTALYELVPAGVSGEKHGVDPLKYQKPPQPSSSADSDELLTVKIRSKDPESDTSVLSEFTVKESEKRFREASQDFKFAAAVAAFGMVLRDSPHKGNADMERALEWAKEGKGTDNHGYRNEFIRLIHRAISIDY